jgi:methionine--tRNA ligase beta chain
MPENATQENNINIEDFLKIEIRLGTIKSVSMVEGSEKLYKLEVDFGEYAEIESEGGITEKEERVRTVYSGIRKYVSAEDLLDKQFPFVTNLEPRKIMNDYSQAMILAANDENGFTLFPSQNKLQNGTRLQ